MTSTINFRAALTADTIEQDTINHPATPVDQPNEANKGGTGRRMIVAGVVATLVAVGAGAILLNDGPSEPAPSVPAVVAPLEASQGPNVDLPASWLDQPTAVPSAVAGPNADLPRDSVRDDANARWVSSRTNQGPNTDLPRDAALEVTNR